MAYSNKHENEFGGQASMDPRAVEKELAYAQMQQMRMSNAGVGAAIRADVRGDVRITHNLGGGEISQQIEAQEKVITMLAEAVSALTNRLQGVVVPRPEVNKDRERTTGTVSSSPLGGAINRHNEAIALQAFRLQKLMEDIVL